MRGFLTVSFSGAVLFLLSLLPTRAKAADLSDIAVLQTQLDTVRSSHQVPGMGAAIVLNGSAQNVVVSGVRKIGSAAPVELDDRFQIGSITKPITSTLAFVLAHKNVFSIRRRILDVFPELRSVLRPAYRKVDAAMLLEHLSAMPYKPAREGSDEFRSISSNMQRRRYEYVRAAVRDKAEGKVGEHYVYSGGSIIVAAMLERLTGRSWEQLVRKHVFNPLGMTSAGFGAMSKRSEVTDIWEHDWNNGAITPVSPPASYAHEVHAPAGRNVHMSVGDLAKFMISNFPYGAMTSNLLPRKSLMKMQEKSLFADTSPGWFVGYDAWSDYKTILHSGDNGKSVALLVFSPKYEAGYVITANMSGQQAWAAVDELATIIEEYFLEILGNTSTAPVLGLAQHSLTYGKQATASNVFLDMQDYQPGQALDGRYTTRWATDYGVTEAWLEVDLESVQKVRSILIKEEFAPRVSSYILWARNNEAESYRKVAQGSRVGEELLITPAAFNARYVRLTLNVDGDAGPTISEFHLFSDRITRVY